MKTPMFQSESIIEDDWLPSEMVVSGRDNMGVNFYITPILGIATHTLTKAEVVNLIVALSNYLAEEEIPNLEKYSPIGT